MLGRLARSASGRGGRTIGRLVAAAVGYLLVQGCGAEPEPRRGREPAASTSTSAGASTTTTATTSSTTLLPAPATADEARRLLERQGIDPAELSREIAEGMRQRFGSGSR